MVVAAAAAVDFYSVKTAVFETFVVVVFEVGIVFAAKVVVFVFIFIVVVVVVVVVIVFIVVVVVFVVVVVGFLVIVLIIVVVLTTINLFKLRFRHPRVS